MRRGWTNKEVTELERLWRAGLTSTEIAGRLNRSRSSIMGQVTRSGLLGQKGTVEDPDIAEPKLRQRWAHLRERMRPLLVEQRRIEAKAASLGLDWRPQ